MGYHIGLNRMHLTKVPVWTCLPMPQWADKLWIFLSSTLKEMKSAWYNLNKAFNSVRSHFKLIIHFCPSCLLSLYFLQLVVLSHLLALCLCGAWAGAPAIGLAPGPAQDQAGHLHLQGAGAGGAGTGGVGEERGGGGGGAQRLLQPQPHGAAALGDRAVKAHGSVWIVFLLCWTFGCSGLRCQGPTGGRGGGERDLWRKRERVSRLAGWRHWRRSVKMSTNQNLILKLSFLF